MKTRRFLLMLVVVSCSCFAWGQSTKTHVVQRGETIERVAQLYGISVEQLKEANPSISQYFYTGMKLTIPESKREETKLPPTDYSNNTPSQDFGIKSIVGATVQTNSSQGQSDNTEENFVEAKEVSFMFVDTDNKYYGLHTTATGMGENWLGMVFDFRVQFVTHGVSCGNLGIGLTPRYVAEPFIVGLNLFPYMGMNSYDVVESVDKHNNPKYKNKIEFAYGAMLDLMAGFKLLTTKSGTDIYLTGSYNITAPEFKTEGAFKNGSWSVGLCWVLND